MPIYIVTPDDTALITAQNEAASNPASFMANINRADVWESTTKTPWIKFAFASARTLDFAALCMTNLTAAATWQIVASNTEGTLFSAPTWTSGAPQTFWLDPNDDNARPSSWMAFTPDAPYQYYGINISDVGNPDPGIRVARAIMGTIFEPTWNMEVGAQVALQDDSFVTVSDAGGVIAEDGPKRMSYTFTLPDLNEDEFFNVVWPMLARGISKDVCFVSDPAAATYKHRRFFWGRLLLSGLAAKRFLSTRYKRSFKMECL